MTDERRYVRVYYSVVNDERFADVYHDARRFGTWLQLLLIADAMYPADAPVPAYVHRPSFKALMDCGLVEERAHQHFRLHGLASERGIRSQSGRNAAAVRWQSEGNADPMPRREEKRREENRLEETSTAREGLSNLTKETIEALELRTGRTWGQAGERQLTEYDRLIEDHGLGAVCEAMDSLRNGRTMTARQLVWGAMKYLEPMLDPRESAKAEQDKEVERNSRRGVEATQRYLADLRSVGSGDS